MIIMLTTDWEKMSKLVGLILATCHEYTYKVEVGSTHYYNLLQASAALVYSSLCNDSYYSYKGY